MADETNTPRNANIESDRHTTADDGHRADILKAALGDQIADLEAFAVERFKQTDGRDDAGLRLCHMYLEVLADIEQLLEYKIETGKNAQRELSKLN